METERKKTVLSVKLVMFDFNGVNTGMEGEVYGDGEVCCFRLRCDLRGKRQGKQRFYRHLDRLVKIWSRMKKFVCSGLPSYQLKYKKIFIINK